MKSFKESNNLLERSLEIIPLGSQTFSKSHYSLPSGAAPLFLERGRGTYVVDVDGNEYIDLVNGLLCVSLGYCDEGVNKAISEQLDNGISFSLPHKLEVEVAELLVELIPCAEMVRFGKNGTDVTSAAIRLARAYTGKNHVAICGYHGWQDWYIGSTTRDLGVPESVKSLSHTFEYNNLNSLRVLFEEHKDMAAVIMEPMGAMYPEPGFLEGVRELCNEKGAVLIFDEIITGFRFQLNGAQTLFGVTPDLATFGKGMANGMPLSAVVGKRKIMKLMEEIFFSGTFGGETLSLIAAKETILRMKNNEILPAIHEVGKYLENGVNKIIDDNDINWFRLVGHDSWKILVIDANENTQLYKSILIQEMIQQGILVIGSHNISYAFKKNHADIVIDAYRKSLLKIEKARKVGCEKDLLVGDMIKPVFKVR